MRHPDLPTLRDDDPLIVSSPLRKKGRNGPADDRVVRLEQIVVQARELSLAKPISSVDVRA
jgi:hypothetical protein